MGLREWPANFEKGLEMDSSSRLNAVLGQFRIAAEELTAEEWFRIVDVCLSAYLPMLKYLPGFKPLEESLNCSVGNSGYNWRVTTPEATEFPPNVNHLTKCLRVAQISHAVEGENRWGAAHGCRYVHKVELYLTIGGRFLLADHKYERVPQDGLGYREHRTGIREEALWWKFINMEGKDLIPMLNAKVGLSILDTLIKAGNESVDQRRSRLKATEMAVRSVLRIRQTID
jgi:hypothetical protein